uniref:mitotic-spindle organizing protein 2 n=1 Tax=Pristiophorus japonicus TaxID=55135 RepID=UPI00398F6F2E
MAVPQQAGISGLDAQQTLLATVSGNVQKYAVKKKKILNAEELELYELTQATGIVMDQEVFKIIVDLLKMNVAPLAVFQMLKAMCAGHRIAEISSTETPSTQAQTSLADSRGHCQRNFHQELDFNEFDALKAKQLTCQNAEPFEFATNPNEAEDDAEEDSDTDEPEEENIFQSHLPDQDGEVMDETPTVVVTLEEVQVPPIEMPAPFLS